MLLPPIEVEQLQHFVSVVIEHWHGFQTAISHGMGGSPVDTRRKVNTMIKELTKYCTQPGIEQEDIKTELEILVDDDFNTEFEDGSPNEVAELIWGHIQQWVVHNDKNPIHEYIKKMENIAPANPIIVQEDEELETDEESEEEISADDNMMDTTDDTNENDGWEIPKYLQKKKKK